MLTCACQLETIIASLIPFVKYQYKYKSIAPGISVFPSVGVGDCNCVRPVDVGMQLRTEAMSFRKVYISLIEVWASGWHTYWRGKMDQAKLKMLAIKASP